MTLFIKISCKCQLTYSGQVRPGVGECGLPAAVRLGDGDFLDEFERLEDVGDVVEAADARLHDGLRQADAVDHARRKVQVYLCIVLKRGQTVLFPPGF